MKPNTFSYIISLNNPDKQLKYLRDDIGLNIRWIKGINGKELSRREIERTTGFNVLFGMFSPPGLLGCALAHIKAWNEFLKTSEENKYVTIFEDDVIVEPTFLDDFNKVMSKLPNDGDFDILLLGYFGEFSSKVKVFFNIVFRSQFTDPPIEQEVNEYWKVPNFSIGAHAYVISREGAKKLLSYIENNIEGHIDKNIQDLFLSRKINLYSLRERIAYQTSTATFSSLNISSRHPFLLITLTDFELDKCFKLNYALSCVLLRLGFIDINTISILHFIVGCVLCLLNVNLSIIIALFLSLSFPDIIDDRNSKNGIISNLLILLLPFLLKYVFKTMFFV